MKRSPKFGPRYGFKKFAEGGKTEAPKAKAKTPPNINANEGIAPPLTPDRRKFLKQMQEAQRKSEAEENARRAESEAKTKANAIKRDKELEAERAQEIADRKYREAADRYDREHKFRKGGSVGSASKRADGCVTKGKTRGKFV